MGDDPVNRLRRKTLWCIPAVAWLLSAGSLSPLPTQAGARDVIWQGDDQSVLLAPPDDESTAPNDHPVALPPEEIGKMLASVRFRYADQDAEASFAVFNEDQLGLLSEALSHGLAVATPSQDVTFSVIGAHRPSPEATIRRNRLTAGRVFFRGQELNFIFGEIQSPYRKKNVYGRIEQDFYPRQFGSRAALGQQDSVIVVDAVADGENGKATRTDWVTFQPGMAGSAGATAARPHGAAESTGEKMPARDETSAAESMAPDIESRLETLRSLREKNLISEEAYREKVDEILEDL